MPGFYVTMVFLYQSSGMQFLRVMVNVSIAIGVSCYLTFLPPDAQNTAQRHCDCSFRSKHCSLRTWLIKFYGIALSTPEVAQVETFSAICTMNIIKGAIVSMGANVTEKSLQRAARSVSTIHAVCKQFDKYLYKHQHTLLRKTKQMSVKQYVQYSQTSYLNRYLIGATPHMPAFISTLYRTRIKRWPLSG